MKKQKGLAPLILIIIGALVVGGLVYFDSNRDKTTYEPVDSESDFTEEDEFKSNESQNNSVQMRENYQESNTEVAVRSGEVTSTQQNEITTNETTEQETEVETGTETSSIRIISPTGGEVYSPNEDIIVNWWDDTDAGNKDIYIIKEDGAEVEIEKNLFIRSSGIDGTFSQNINNLSSGRYKVKVCKTGTNECATSSAFIVS